MAQYTAKPLATNNRHAYILLGRGNYAAPSIFLAHVQLACSEEAPKHIRRMRAAVTRFVFISAS